MDRFPDVDAEPIKHWRDSVCNESSSCGSQQAVAQAGSGPTTAGRTCGATSATTTSNALSGSLSGSLLEQLLTEQQQPFAVETFARHLQSDQPAQAKYYRDLIPAAAPAAGEQYAFEVDLDTCSGCKACVTACHQLNGLEDDELWRSVGLLHGGSDVQPVLQHVTTACHHCIEPACMAGCPVEAYEKDPVTGIVRHLDDQCIGCQYCILKCPYDVPQYSASKGIVRKCDMCSDRLAAHEAPACVQACPERAIRIQIVSNDSTLEQCETGGLVPTAPDSEYTIPTTVYKTQRPLPTNVLPADYYLPRSEHSHLPLVLMLVLTQMSVGGVVMEQLLFSPRIPTTTLSVRLLHLVVALTLGMLGLAASVLHLGRPLYAYRALLGLRHSWLSREILAFSLFAGLAVGQVGVGLLNNLAGAELHILEKTLGIAAALSGVIAVGCSIMIYVDTRRPFWNATYTTAKFTLTSVVLGAATMLLVSVFAGVFVSESSPEISMTQYGDLLCQVLRGALVAKLAVESSIFTYLRRKQLSPLRRTAMLLTGQFGQRTVLRYLFAGAGGLLLPTVLVNRAALSPEGSFHPLFYVAASTLVLVLLLVGETIERQLFFAASVAPKMPGGAVS